MKSKGFTLIELLIVVAIIAILAAIAVPNFLEAQTRAKISQVLTNQRTIATATESYRVDWNLVPTSALSGSRITDRWGFAFWLTTPISYMAAVPEAPEFDKKDPVYGVGTNTGDIVMNRFGFYPMAVYNRDWYNRLRGIPEASPSPTNFSWICETTFQLRNSQGSYMQWSNGPAGGNAYHAVNGGYGYEWTTYDPSNGTISRGLLMRLDSSVTLGGK